jgi:putative copper resistance protein D
VIELDPVVILLLALSAGLYARAVRRLSRRGYSVPRLQQACWWTGLLLVGSGLLGPLAALSDKLLSAHMAEHLVIADIAAPFLIAGIRTPVGLFMPPRDVLVAVARNRPVRVIGQFVTKPLVALPLYVLVLYGWHLAPAFTSATETPLIHALQHQSFLIANLILWWPALEPSKRPMPAPLWKVGYLLGARMASVLMGAVFLVSNRPFYGNLYSTTAPDYGFTALSDQQVGASIMMVTDVIMMMAILAFFFARAASAGAAKDAAEDARRSASHDAAASAESTPAD